jgi:cytochrome c5
MKAIRFLPLLVAVALTACGEKNTSTETASAPPAAPAASAAPAPAPAPQAAPATAAAPSASATAAASTSAAAPSAADLAKGEKVYNATCQACHAAGVLGAPKFGDKALWAPRIAQGIDTLHNNAINGIRMMPPKGGNAALSDDEVKAAVDYMVSKAKWSSKP